MSYPQFRMCNYMSAGTTLVTHFSLYRWHFGSPCPLLFPGRSGVFQALSVSAGGNAVQTEEPEPAERHPAAVLWTVLLRYCVRPPALPASLSITT